MPDPGIPAVLCAKLFNEIENRYDPPLHDTHILGR